MTPDAFYPIFQKHSKISTDSRAIEPGSVFFALRGDHFNGNRFAQDALDQGAAFAVVDDPEIATDDRIVLVEDVLVFLQQLARFHRQKFSIPVIGLTGTNGKTTTKELIHSVLRKNFQTQYTIGNLNNHIGVPLTVLSLMEDTQILIVEMGANHPGEIAQLCSIAQPTHALITNIGKAHLEGFGSIEGVMQAKGELYSYVKDQHGIIFRNCDDPYLEEVLGDYPSITYGTTSDCMVYGTDSGSTRNLNMSWISDRLSGGHLPIHSQLAGNYNLYNILAAIAVADVFNIPSTWIKQGIESYRPVNMRSEWQETDSNTIWLDAYNANPSSMKLAIEGFHALQAQHKTLILGDMFELGASSELEHNTLLELILELGFGEIYVCGDQFHKLTMKGVSSFATTADLKNYLNVHPLHGRTILLKGSRGMKMEDLMDVL